MVRILLMALLTQATVLPQAGTGSVTGVLRTSKGVPVEGMRVAVAPVDDSLADVVLESLTLSDSTGHFRLENVSPGRYHIVVGRTGSIQYFPGVATREDAKTVDVTPGAVVDAGEMLFQRAAVYGRVTDLETGAGRRIRSLQLCCDRSQATVTFGGLGVFIGEGPNERFTASISDDGSFVFPGVPAGSYTITTDDPSIVPTVFPLIVASQDLEDVKVQVSSGVSVKGKVTDKGGKAISAAIRLRPSPANPVFEVDQPQGSVSAIYLAVSTPIPPQGIVPTLAEIRALLYQAAKTPSVIAGADGNFVFNKALPGTYTLTTTAIGQSFEREIQIGPEGLTQLDIQLPVTLIMGRFIAESGVPPPQLQGAIRFVNLGSDGKTTYGFPDADGNLSVLLPEGEFRLFTDNLNHPVRSITDGTRDLLNSPFVIDGAAGHSLEIVVARE